MEPEPEPAAELEPDAEPAPAAPAPFSSPHYDDFVQYFQAERLP
eukprot:SAG11_NODE_39577_length_228_cov_11.038760_1_plen_43_part_10